MSNETKNKVANQERNFKNRNEWLDQEITINYQTTLRSIVKYSQMEPEKLTCDDIREHLDWILDCLLDRLFVQVKGKSQYDKLEAGDIINAGYDI